MNKPLPPRKSLTDYSIGLCSGHVAILPPDQLHADGTMPENFAQIYDQFHIYLIGRRPALAIDPETLRYEEGVIHGHLTYRVDGQATRLPFSYSHPLPEGTVDVVAAPYPHRDYRAVDGDGEILEFWPTLIIPSYANIGHGLDELDIVYVGQAFGDGSRNALDRLRSHSTLQKILADTAAQQPDDEVVIVLAQFPQYRVFSIMDGRVASELSDDQDKERFFSVLDNPLSEHAQVCLAEAGLIRYFQPRYNEIYKSRFPKQDQKILDACYKLDFSAIIVEINTEDIGLYLKSDHMRRGLHHMAKYDLHDLAKRRSFFALTDTSDALVATMNEGGPLY